MCLLSFGSDENLRDPLLLHPPIPASLLRVRRDSETTPWNSVSTPVEGIFLLYFFSFFPFFFSLSLFPALLKARVAMVNRHFSLSLSLSIQFHEPFSIVRPSSTTSSTYARLILYFSIDSVHCSYQGRGWPPWKGRDELAGAGEARRANVINYPGNDSDWWAAGQVQPASK